MNDSIGAPLGDAELVLENARRQRLVLLQSVTKRGLTTHDAGEGLHAAILLKEFGDSDAAKRVFSRLNAIHGADSAVVYERAVFLRGIGAPEAAHRVISRAIHVGPAGDRIPPDGGSRLRLSSTLAILPMAS